MSISTVFSWLVANYGNVLGALAVLVAGASVLIKALEGVVAVLLTLFPALKTTDGKLLHVAGWLDALSKSSWLNSAALSPKKQA